jgi:hypothetical protein
MRDSFYCVFFMVVLSFGNCAIGPTHGFIWTDTRFPGEFNTENNIQSKKFGKGCLVNILGLVSFGNAGAGRVARENGISKIASIDHSFTGVLYPIYGRYCTIVGGE